MEINFKSTKKKNLASENSEIVKTGISCELNRDVGYPPPSYWSQSSLENDSYEDRKIFRANSYYGEMSSRRRRFVIVIACSRIQQHLPDSEKRFT